LIERLRQLASWRPDDGRLFIWRLLWFPFWFGGDIPAPWLPEHERRLKAGSPAAMGAASAIDSIGRRIWVNWIIACIARGLWLPFAIGSVVGLIDLARGNHFAPEKLIWVWAVTLPLGLLLGLFLRPRRRRVAWMMDHTFNLHDRMTTAVEALETDAPPAGSRASMTYLQLADTANAAIGLRRDPRFRLHLPARELSLAILAGLMLCALLFLRGIGGHIPGAAETAVPIFVPAADRQIAAETPNPEANPVAPPATVDEVNAKSARSNAAREDLNAIADALDENAITQPAADAIRSGDYATAAQEIRDAASHADELSPESQATLADALDQAAASAQDSSPALADAASESADGLREGGTAAESSMRDLGDAVDLAGESVVPQSQLDAEMKQAQENEANPQTGGDAAPNQASNPSDPSQTTGSQPNSNTAPGDNQQAPGSSAPNTDSPGSNPSDPSQPSTSDPSDQQPTDNADNKNPDGPPSETKPGDQPGDPNQPGDSQNPGEGPSDQPGQPSDSQPGSDSVSQSPPNAQPGGSTSPGDPSNSDSSEPSTDKENPGGGNQPSDKKNEETVPPAPTNVSQAPTPSGPGTESTVVPTASAQLPGGESQEQVSLGPKGGSASAGNGNGATVAEGTATQEAIATAGPESNSVPPEYRSVVENYFNRDTP
jgi:hypothetical protein